MDHTSSPLACVLSADEAIDLSSSLAVQESPRDAPSLVWEGTFGCFNLLEEGGEPLRRLPFTVSCLIRNRAKMREPEEVEQALDLLLVSVPMLITSSPLKLE
jgi:hypothetical protein